MTCIALFSDKGGPGVTTLALGLATVWPRPCVLVELDPAGGDLALRLTDSDGRPQLGPEPGLLTLAVALRRDPAASPGVHAQPIVTGTRVVPGLLTPRQCRGMAGLWSGVRTAVTTAADDVIVDLGRLWPDSPVLDVVAAADVLVGVVRAEAAAMLRLRDRLRELLDDLPPASARRVAVVLVAESRQAAEARAAMSRVLLHGAVAAEVAGTVVVDARGVAALYAGGSGPGLGRSVFLRSVRGLVPRLTETGPAFATGSGLPAPRRRSVWSR